MQWIDAIWVGVKSDVVIRVEEENGRRVSYISDDSIEFRWTLLSNHHHKHPDAQFEGEVLRGGRVQ